jgi:hypothetical protein
MNAAEIVQHRLQQISPGGCPLSVRDRRKFRCVFKDSSGK